MTDTGTLTRAEIMEARDNDPLWPKPQPSSASAASDTETAPPRLCEICDENIDDFHPRAKTCHKEDCKKELANRRLRRNREEKKAEAERKAQAEKSGAQADPAPGPDAADESPSALASLLATSSRPVGDADGRQGSAAGDRLGRIETAAEKFLEACARERTAQQVRITAERRLAEALSVDQGT